MGDLERGYTDATPASDTQEKMDEYDEHYSEMCKPESERKKEGYIERNNYGDRL